MVYYGSVEYKYKPGAINYGKYKGGFVYIFLKAMDVLECISKIKSEFDELNLEITAIEFLTPYEETPWENKADQVKYDSLAEKAQTDNGFVFDDFYAFEEE